MKRLRRNTAGDRLCPVKGCSLTSARYAVLALQARQMVSLAIRHGVYERGPCEVCGREPVRTGTTYTVLAHHDHYGLPLDIRWLCHRHHAAWHLRHLPGYPPDSEDDLPPFEERYEAELEAYYRRHRNTVYRLANLSEDLPAWAANHVALLARPLTSQQQPQGDAR